MAVGIYIHVPFCAKKCPYCDFYSLPYRKSKAESYVDAVCRNIQAQLPVQTPVDTVYFGGGTPSLLPPDAIWRMMQAVAAQGILSADAECTLEANPLTVTSERLTAWRAAGINRLSIGVQSFQPQVLQILGRTHSADQARAAVERAQDAGFENISVDLMLGLVQQDAAMLHEDLETAVSLSVQHISAYLLKIEAHTPFAEQPPQLADEDETAERYLQMHSELTAHGFLHYEISNFAQAGYESRHNCKYWRCQPYIGIGPGAHSFCGTERRAVPRDLDAFCEQETQPFVTTDLQAGGEGERILLGLRLAEGILLSSLPESGSRLLQNARGLMPQYVRQDGDRLYMTPEGWLVSNAVLVRLLDGIEH